MISPSHAQLIIAVEDEPLPRGPSGESSRLKLKDWLELAKQFEKTVHIKIIGLGELGNHRPDIIEAFATRHGFLTKSTFPTQKEHDMLNRFSDYWPKVEKSGIPAIGVIRGVPKKFPVFVRGEQGTFARGGLVRSTASLKRLMQSGRPIIVRPWVEILPADNRTDVRLELRVHVVGGSAVAVEYLFPPWASQRPTEQELHAGQAWTEANRLKVVQYAEQVATEIECRWFVADFAGTAEGLRLIELNPGWCSGIAHADAARSVHLSILERIFKIRNSP